MTTFATDRLRGLLGKPGDGLAAPNRWRVQVAPINGRVKVDGSSVGHYSSDDLNLLATQVRIPSKVLRTLDRNMGMATDKIGVGFEPGNANFTFYLNHRYTARNYFQDWMDCVVSRTPPFEAGFFKNYKADMSVYQLDKVESARYGVKLIDCYPSSINELELNNAVQTAALELTVTIVFKHYEVIDLAPAPESSTQPGKTTGSIFTPVNFDPTQELT